MTFGPSLTDSPEPLSHCRNVVNLSLFCKYYYGRCSSELGRLVSLLFSRGRSTHIVNTPRSPLPRRLFIGGLGFLKNHRMGEDQDFLVKMGKRGTPCSSGCL